MVSIACVAFGRRSGARVDDRTAPRQAARWILGVVVAAFGLGLAAPAQALSPEDEADVKRVEDYFNSMTTMEARFIQLSPNGRFAQGSIHLNMPPGQLRFEYDPPVPYLLIVNDGDVIFYDKEIEAPSFLSLSQTPLEFLLGGEVKLSGEVTVVGVERGPGILRVRVVQTEKQEQGMVEITFSDRPFVLKKWSLVDSEGQAIHVALLDARFGIDLDPKLFEFEDTRMLDSAGGDR